MLTLSDACQAVHEGNLSVQDAAFALDAASQLHASTRKNQGVTYTPWDVACQVVAQADPKPSDTWLDTSLGRGIFLWATLAHMQSKGFSLQDIEDFLATRMHAVELDTEAAVDARALLVAWCACVGIKPPVRDWLHQGDSLAATLPDVDVLVGNPPYVRIQHLAPMQRELLRSNFTSCALGNVDLYYAFFEQALRAAKRGALIAPNSWLTNTSAAALRQLVAPRTTKVIDFYDVLLFAPVRAYTAVWVWNEASMCGTHLVRKEGWTGPETRQARTAVCGQPGPAWPDPLRVAKVGNHATQPLADLATVHTGLATLADKIYTVRLVSQDTATLEWTCLAFDGSTVVIEDAVLAPLYKWTKDKTAGYKAAGTRAAIYPYHASGKAMTDSDFLAVAPLAHAYLAKYKVELGQRDKGQGRYESWFAYGRRQGLRTPHDHALGVPTMWSGPTTPVHVDDANSPYLFVSGYVLRPLPGIDVARLAQALAHPDVWEQVLASGKMWAGDKPYRTLGAPLLRTLRIAY